MNNAINTEENKPKRNYTKIIIILVILILLIVFIYFVFNMIKNNKKEKTVDVTINEELKDIKNFAILNNYIVGINSDNSVVRIYNLLQGTGQFGDFTNYFYNDNKLYLLFSDNVIYTISLESGNGVYELSKYFTIDSVSCTNNTTSNTTDLEFVGNGILLNNSSCAVSMIKYDNKTKSTNLSNIKIYNKEIKYIEYSSSLNALYIYADNNISKLDLKTGDIEVIKENINTDIFEIKNDILIYSNTVNNEKTYYGYNIKTKVDTNIVTNAKELIMYNKSFIYTTDSGIYLISGNTKDEVYKVHYNSLSNMELINNATLQVLDTDTNDEEKKRIINIDLKNKYKTSISDNLFSNIVEYK